MYVVHPEYPLIVDNEFKNKSATTFSTDQVTQRVHWKHGPINYKWNSLGHRTKELKNLNSEFILTFGCSYTEGVGLHTEQIWNYHVSAALGIDLYNLAKQGTGMDVQFMNATFWINSQLPKPKYVIVQWPHKARKSFGFKETYGIRVADMSETNTKDGVWWGKRYIDDTGDMSLNNFMWYENFNTAWKSIGVPVLNFTWDDDLAIELERSRFELHTIFPETYDKARDNQHDGPIFHKQTSERLLKIINSGSFTDKV